MSEVWTLRPTEVSVDRTAYAAIDLAQVVERVRLKEQRNAMKHPVPTRIFALTSSVSECAVGAFVTWVVRRGGGRERV